MTEEQLELLLELIHLEAYTQALNAIPGRRPLDADMDRINELRQELRNAVKKDPGT